jgi:hypothetical protein
MIRESGGLNSNGTHFSTDCIVTLVLTPLPLGVEAAVRWRARALAGMVEAWLKGGGTAPLGKFRDGGRRSWGKAAF